MPTPADPDLELAQAQMAIVGGGWGLRIQAPTLPSWLDPWLSKWTASESPLTHSQLGLTASISDSVRLGKSLTTCIANKFQVMLVQEPSSQNH